MLTLVARHGAMDLELTARGDLEVDQHHTVEDTGIVLGEAVRKALGSKRGILRAGYFLMPMDETLAAAAIDFSGRPHLVCKWKFSAKHVGGLQTELLEDFFGGFAQAAGANVHLQPAVWPLVASPSGSDLQGVRQGAAFCGHARSAIEARAAEHEGALMNIALVEYGAGNLPSVERALSRLGVESRRASSPEGLAGCDALILPGVGHFGALMRSLGERSLVAAVARGRVKRQAAARNLPRTPGHVRHQRRSARRRGPRAVSRKSFRAAARRSTAAHGMEPVAPRAGPASCSKAFRRTLIFISRILMPRSMQAKRASPTAITARRLSRSSSRRTFSPRNSIPKNRDRSARKSFPILCGMRKAKDEPRAPHHSMPRY